MRTALAALLAIVLLPIVVVGNAQAWGTRTVLNDDVFTTTVGRALDAPAVETAVADALADRLAARLATGLERLDPRLVAVGLAALGLPSEPTDDDLQAWLAPKLTVALRSERVEAARDRIVRAVHGALINVGEGDGPVRIRGDELVLDAGELVDAAIEGLDASAIQLLPEATPRDTEIVLAQADQIRTIQRGLTIARAAQAVTPLVILAIVLLIVVLAHRRVRALGIVGVVLMLAGLVTLAVAWVGGGTVAAFPDDPTAGQVAGQVYDAFLSVLVDQSLLLVVAGAAVAVLAWTVLRLRRRPGAQVAP
jgi:hypothetical protein